MLRPVKTGSAPSACRYKPPMSRRSDHPAAPFTAPERDLLRRELCRHFGEDPLIADGIFLRTWRGGERRNQPKIPPAVQTMLARGLVEVRTTQPRAPRLLHRSRAGGIAAARARSPRHGPGAFRASAGRARDRSGISCCRVSLGERQICHSHSFGVTAFAMVRSEASRTAAST